MILYFMWGFKMLIYGNKSEQKEKNYINMSCFIDMCVHVFDQRTPVFIDYGRNLLHPILVLTTI